MDENFGQSYLDECDDWRNRYIKEWDAVKRQVFDLEASFNTAAHEKYKEYLDNMLRFKTHLDKITYELGIDWWDGDFPIEDVLRKIRSLQNQ